MEIPILKIEGKTTNINYSSFSWPLQSFDTSLKEEHEELRLNDSLRTVKSTPNREDDTERVKNDSDGGRLGEENVPIIS